MKQQSHFLVEFQLVGNISVYLLEALYLHKEIRLFSLDLNLD
jgi:hypothetical protein